MPVWMIAADFSFKLNLSGRWVGLSLLAGALLCAGVVATSGIPLFRRILVVFGSGLLLIAEVLAIGAVLVAKGGLEGIQ